ncbi:MAG: hypothetical protein ACYDAQ_16960 [Mycobacteriales bacterium]
MAAGSLVRIVAVALWMAGWEVSAIVPWLAGFLVLTVAGERLVRVVGVTRAARVGLLAVVSVFGARLVVGTVSVATWLRLAGFGLFGLTVWLAVHDAPRRNVRQFGLTRYMAVCLLAGYGWLAVAGLLWLEFATLSDGRRTTPCCTPCSSGPCSAWYSPMHR